MAMMISKFHKIIQSRTVWAAFAVLISVAFVGVYTGAKSGNQKQPSEVAKEVVGKLYGKNVSRIEYGRAYQNAYLLLVLRTGQGIKINAQVDDILRQTAWQRLAILKKAEQMGLSVTGEQIASSIRQQAIFRNQQSGMFDRNAYDAFFTQILPRLGLRMYPKDFEILMHENLLIDKASSTAIQGALVTEAEVDHAFHVYSDTLTVQYATIPRSLAPAPAVTEDDARKYYDNYPNQFTYPDKVKVRYVEFSVADYTDQIEVTDEMVSNFYTNYKQRFVVEGTEGNPVPDYKPLDAVKDTIVDEIKTALARRQAATEAGTFVSRLSSQSATFEQLAAESEKTITGTPPFAMTDTVRGVDPTAPFAQAAFGLQNDANHFYSDPVVGKDSVYILVLQDKMPAFLPDFDIVAEDALEAARISASEKAYVEKAESVHADIEIALKAGMSFEEAAAKAGLKAGSMDPFSVAEPPEGELGQSVLKATALFDGGTLVDLTTTDDEYLVAYVAARDVADRATADPELIEQLRSSVLNDKAARLTAAWQDEVLKEAKLEDLLDASNSDNS